MTIDTTFSNFSEKCYGIIPLIRREGEWNVYLVKLHSGGHWSFPKGHSLANEAPLDTAIRELKEETNLDVARFLLDVPLHESYQFIRDGHQVDKTVSYYIAEVIGEASLQLLEIAGGKWVLLKEAESYLTYPEARSLCRQVIDLLPKTPLISEE